ncbi:SRPBCC family protein [Jiangella asiatica]|uniref:SRPBCC domain-containing protein n=1 Tax=Jiangella asiatica TaxID=2530372 RepID=A0A4R5DHS9_9ACTN|nr:SRPBCC domain-containing protein [Jiangella asiatica]TDE11490.1 SRPBCC domain-containing protein [Jiangella asiatica]
MTVTRVEKDFDALTLTVVAEFAAPVERVWQLWADPRQLERWWGPPDFPMSVHSYDLSPGGVVTYVLTGSGGQSSRGRWRVAAVTPPTALEFTDGFADRNGDPVAGAPTTSVRVELSADGDGTRMVVRSVFSSREHMEQLAELGAMDIFAGTIGQMDAVLADGRPRP